jgi:hypothetical protein
MLEAVEGLPLALARAGGAHPAESGAAESREGARHEEGGW